jgi:hypothetical protein
VTTCSRPLNEAGLSDPGVERISALVQHLSQSTSF